MKATPKQSTATAAVKHKTGQSFFQKKGEESTAVPDREAFFSSGQRTGSDPQSDTPFFQKSSRPFVQTKLTVGQPGDPYEQEADAMADKVVQRLAQPDADSQQGLAANKVTPVVQLKSTSAPPNNSNASTHSHTTTPVIQPKCDTCEKEEKEQTEEGEALPAVQRKPIFDSNGDEALQMKCAACEQEEQTLQPKSASETGSSGTNLSQIESSLSSSKGSGSPLPETTRSQMEGAFGADFSGVRVHTSGTAVQMNRDLQAHAFTHGSDVYFNSGKYDPGSTEGKRLLGHELTHVVQQGGAGNSSTVQPRVQRLFGWVSDAASWVGDTASGAIDSVVDGAEWVGQQISDGASWVGDRIVEGVEWIFERIQSVISSGTEWLNEKWVGIQEFAVSSFDDLKNGFGSLIGLITSPMSTLFSVFNNMDANLLETTWAVLKQGANALWNGVESVVNGVLQFGEGIWNTVSGFVDGIFSTAESLFDNAAFRLLPDWMQESARSIFNTFRSLWSTISSFWTNLWQRLTALVQSILSAIKSFISQIAEFAIEGVITAVRNLKEVYDYVSEIFADPRAFIQPYIDQLAAKINSEAPNNARSAANDKINEQSGSQQSANNGIVQMDSVSNTEEERRTATFDEVFTGIPEYIEQQWSLLDIPSMLWDTLVNMFWPPATLEAIGHQFMGLWNDDWTNTLNSLYTPRNFFDDPIGCLHDVWSNYLILLEFPLALWRRLNSIIMLLMGYITILLIIIEAIIGGVAGAAAGGVGAIPGALAGAAAGLETAIAFGEFMFASYFLAEGATVSNSLLQLFTARQTCIQREQDMCQISSSLIGMGVATAIQLLMALLAELISMIVNQIRGVSVTSPAAEPAVPAAEPAAPAVEPAAPAVEPAAPAVEPPAPAVEPPAPAVEPPAPAVEPPAPAVEPPAPAVEPPAPAVEPPAPAVEPPAPAVEPPAPAIEPPAPTVEPPAPAVEPPAPGRVIPFPRRQTPQPVAPPEELPIAAKFEEGKGPHLLPDSYLDEDQSSDAHTDESEFDENPKHSIPTSRTGNVIGVTAGGAAGNVVQKCGIKPEKCKKEKKKKCKDSRKRYEWVTPHDYEDMDGVLRFCDDSLNDGDFTTHAHHVWPKFIGGPERQTRLNVDWAIHLREFHGNQGPHNNIHRYLSALFQDRSNNLPITDETTSPGNVFFIGELRRDSQLRYEVGVALTGYYSSYTMDSNPILPVWTYATGINESIGSF